MKLASTLFAVVFALGSYVSSHCAAQATRPAAEGPDVIKLSLHPVPATRPALKYKLLPDVTEQRPGDAAPLYLMASRVGPDPKAAEDLAMRAADQFFDMPMDQLAKADTTATLAPFAERMELLDLAARREDVRWDFALREQGATAKLLHLREMRVNATLLSLTARHQVARHDWAAASGTLQTGLSMARQLNDRPVLVQGLIEVGIAEVLLLRVREWASEPDAPNLYWSLTDLPEPFVDLRAISQWERGMIYFTFPALSRTKPEDLTAQEWHDALLSLGRLTAAARAERVENVKLDVLIKSSLQKARAFLAAEGVPKSKVDSMSAEQVVGIYLLRQYQQAADDVWKAWELPFWQGDRVMRETAGASGGPDVARARMAENPLLVLIPSVRSARLQFARHERLVCVLRVIEALRDFAAHHEGHLPASLDEMTALPVPTDPVTGKAFPYKLSENVAVLDAPSADPNAPSRGARYELTIAR